MNNENALIVPCPKCGQEHQIPEVLRRAEVQCVNCKAIFLGDKVDNVFREAIDELHRGEPVSYPGEEEIRMKSAIDVYEKYPDKLREELQPAEEVRKIWITGNGIIACTFENIFLIESKGVEKDMGGGILGNILSTALTIATLEVKSERIPLQEVTKYMITKEGRLMVASDRREFSTSAAIDDIADSVIKYLGKLQEIKNSNDEDQLVQLERLGALREKGVLTEEEFLKKKRAILE